MVAIILLYFKLGVSAVIGASIFILAAPLQYYIARQMSVQQKKVMVSDIFLPLHHHCNIVYLDKC